MSRRKDETILMLKRGHNALSAEVHRLGKVLELIATTEPNGRWAQREAAEALGIEPGTPATPTGEPDHGE